MSRSARLGVVLALNVALVAGLIGVGLSAHSLGVLAESADYLADAIGVCLFAIWLSHDHRLLDGRTAIPEPPRSPHSGSSE